MSVSFTPDGAGIGLRWRRGDIDTAAYSGRPCVSIADRGDDDMLGMNDAGYRPFDQGLFDTYSKGYQHIVDSG